MEIELSDDQALVLSDWLDRVMHKAEFAAVVDDRAVWSALLRVSGALDTQIPAIFSSSYADRLREAQDRLITELGDFGDRWPDG